MDKVILPKPSALSSHLSTHLSQYPSPDHEQPYISLALQIEHSLRYEHRWTRLHLHTHSPLDGRRLARPMLAGTPPQRLYVHPDEQVEMVSREARKGGKKGGEVLRRGGDGRGEEEGDMEEIWGKRPEREWVLPTHLGEKWTLRRLAEIFGGVGVVPPDRDEGEDDEGADAETKRNMWRSKKRVLLAVVNDDSTIVYYIVHDGIMKPRQN
ncbi:hypothetical protein M501DRAFT_1009007 [Patellaria atrata CBS 101060]|uniref:tRNA-splicing endonuclease subunit Sen15 domain-containing protein n=1 Tax=Patellaria atrata CBS 101060 TaxID=1346257 RepID=A0A9P4VKP7_9PEZI|nr:hypothetical protein M501DRAFT_1009007 [Patellaria atrata CBS 101060]